MDDLLKNETAGFLFRHMEEITVNYYE